MKPEKECNGSKLTYEKLVEILDMMYKSKPKMHAPSQEAIEGVITEINQTGFIHLIDASGNLYLIEKKIDSYVMKIKYFYRYDSFLCTEEQLKKELGTILF